MVEASQWYSLISVGSSSLALLAAAYVVRKIPNRRVGDTFVLAMVFFVLAGTFAYLLRTSTLDYGSNSGPLTLARLFYFFHMLAVGFTASFIGQYFLGFEIMRRRLVNLFLQVSLLIVAIGVTTQVTQLEHDYGIRDGGPLRGRGPALPDVRGDASKRGTGRGAAAFRPEGRTRVRDSRTAAAAGVPRGRRSGPTRGAGPRDHAPHSDGGPRR